MFVQLKLGTLEFTDAHLGWVPSVWQWDEDSQGEVLLSADGDQESQVCTSDNLAGDAFDFPDGESTELGLSIGSVVVSMSYLFSCDLPWGRMSTAHHFCCM
jgi:hypothetical protein